MSRPIPSSTLEAAVRAHFGLTQEELGRYLGVSERQVGNLEAGRRVASAALILRLERLVHLLPPPLGAGVAAPIFEELVLPEAPAAAMLAEALPPFEALAAAPLRVRQRQVSAQITKLREVLHRESRRASVLARRQWGLAGLQAALLGARVDAVERAHIARWLRTLATDVAAATPNPVALAERALIVARLLALEVEAAAVVRLLAAG